MRRQTRLSSKRNQRGFGLIDMLLAMTLFVIVLAYAQRWDSNREMENYAGSIKTKVNYLIDRSQQYYMENALSDTSASTTASSYPSSYDDLTDAGVAVACSADDEKNQKCLRMNILPIGSGEEVEFENSLNSDGYAQLKLTFSLSGEDNTFKKNLLRKNLISIPGFEMDDDENVTFTINRPASSLAFDNVVLRDGSHDMTGTEWDYGGTATLDNVVDISFTGLTDRTAITSMVKNGSSYISSSSGVTVTKPECPTGYDPTITTYWIGTGGSVEYTEMGNFDTWYENTSSTYWTVKVRFAALKNGSTARQWHYQGNVGYWTWCDL